MTREERYRIYRLARFILRRRRRNGQGVSTLCALLSDVIGINKNSTITPERLLPEFAEFRPVFKIEESKLIDPYNDRYGKRFWPFWWPINDYRSRLIALSTCISKTK